MIYDEAGPPGPLVLCLPWFGASRAMTRSAFEPAFDGVAVRRLYADLPGHGETAAGPTQPTSEAILSEIVTFIERRTGLPLLLAGCSYGAYVAAALTRRRPDLVRGLLLVCPGVRRDRDLPGPAKLPSEPGWLTAAPAELRGHLEQALGRRTQQAVQAVVAALASGGQGDEAFQAALQGGNGYFFYDDDHETVFDGSVLVATGRQDRVVGYADQFRRMSAYPRGAFAVADAAGHYLPYEQPDLFRALTLEWLQRCGIR